MRVALDAHGQLGAVLTAVGSSNYDGALTNLFATAARLGTFAELAPTRNGTIHGARLHAAILNLQERRATGATVLCRANDGTDLTTKTTTA